MDLITLIFNIFGFSSQETRRREQEQEQEQEAMAQEAVNKLIRLNEIFLIEQRIA
jgi:hypothetical protein